MYIIPAHIYKIFCYIRRKNGINFHFALAQDRYV